MAGSKGWDGEWVAPFQTISKLSPESRSNLQRAHNDAQKTYGF